MGKTEEVERPETVEGLPPGVCEDVVVQEEDAQPSQLNEDFVRKKVDPVVTEGQDGQVDERIEGGGVNKSQTVSVQFEDTKASQVLEDVVGDGVDSVVAEMEDLEMAQVSEGAPR